MLLANNQSTRDAAIRSFGPVLSKNADHIEDNPITGIGGTDRFDFEKFKSPDDIRQQFTSITSEQISACSCAIVKKHIIVTVRMSTDFLDNSLGLFWCRLDRIHKVDTPAMVPEAFFNYLYLNYGDRTAKSPGFQNGRNYGLYKPSYDPFSFFFNAIPQNPEQHEKVTWRIVDWKPQEQ